MKLRNAKFYNGIVKQNYKKEFTLVMSEIINQIANSSLLGYSKTIVSIKNIMKEHEVEIEETKFCTFRSLIIKTLQAKNFGFKTNPDDTLNIYW